MSVNDMSLRRLSFKADWYQEEASVIRSYTICFYLADNSIEVFDQRTKRVFLRRTKMKDLTEKDFYVGSKISIFGRQFDIVDYADEYTRNMLAKYRKKTFMLLKSNVLDKLGDILCALIDSEFYINKGLMIQFTTEHVKMFMGEKTKGDTEISVLMNQLLKGNSMAFEVVADDAVEKLRVCHQHEDMDTSTKLPQPLYALFEGEEMRNGIYVAANEETALRHINFFFESKLNLVIPLELKNSTLAIVKPHCIKEGHLGKIIKDITSNGFKITGMRMHLLERPNCEEFYEVYRGVLQEYIVSQVESEQQNRPLVAQLSSGVSMALELSCTDPTKDTHKEFRTLCGPMDPQIARLLRPNTLRAKFGTNKTVNAVHCTDLPEDTELELRYLFKILT